MTTALQPTTSEPRSFAQYLYGDFGELGGDTSPAATALAMQTLSMILSPLALTRGVVAGVNNVINDKNEKDIAWSAILSDVIYGVSTLVPFFAKTGRWFKLKGRDPSLGFPPSFLERASSALAYNHLLLGCARIFEPLAVGAGLMGAGVDAMNGNRDDAWTSLAYMAPHLLWMAPIGFRAKRQIAQKTSLLSKALAVPTAFFPHTDRPGVAKELTETFTRAFEDTPATPIWEPADAVSGPSILDHLVRGRYDPYPSQAPAGLGRPKVTVDPEKDTVTIHVHTAPKSQIGFGALGLLCHVVHAGQTVGEMAKQPNGLQLEQIRYLAGNSLAPSLVPDLETLTLHGVQNLKKQTGPGVVMTIQHFSEIEIFLKLLERQSQVAKLDIAGMPGIKEARHAGVLVESTDHLSGFAKLREHNPKIPLNFFGSGTRTSNAFLNLNVKETSMTEDEIITVINKLRENGIRVKVRRDRKTKEITQLTWKNNSDPGLVYKQHTGALEAAILAQEPLILSSMDLKRHTADIFYHTQIMPPKLEDLSKDLNGVTLQTLLTTSLTKKQKGALKAAAKQWYDEIVEKKIKAIVAHSPHLTDYIPVYAIKTRAPWWMEVVGISKPYLTIRHFFESARA